MIGLPSSTSRTKPVGWHGEPARHALAARGVVTRTARRVTRGYDRPAIRINAGSCHAWAFAVVSELTKEGIEAEVIGIFDTEGQYTTPPSKEAIHCVVKVGDRYYDAETPNGVDNLEDVPFMKRAKYLRDIDERREWPG